MGTMMICVSIGAAQAETDLCITFPKPSRREEARAVAISLSIIAFTVVGLRCISRYLVDHRLWWDDWMIIAATVYNPKSED